MINFKGEMYGVFKNFKGGYDNNNRCSDINNINTNINISLNIDELINTFCKKINYENNLIEPIYFK